MGVLIHHAGQSIDIPFITPVEMTSSSHRRYHLDLSHKRIMTNLNRMKVCWAVFFFKTTQTIEILV